MPKARNNGFVELGVTTLVWLMVVVVMAFQGKIAVSVVPFEA